MHPVRFYQFHSFLMQFANALSVGLYIPYLLHLGLTRADSFLVNVIYWLTIAATEVPTGALADGKSRSWSVRVGIGLTALGTAVYATAVLADGKWAIMAIAILAEALEGIGCSFMSGAKQAWISDALKRENRESEQGTVMGRAAKLGHVGLLTGGATSFFLVDLGFTAGWIIRTLAILLALAVCARYMNGEGEPIRRTTEIQSLRDSWHALRRSRSLKWAALGAIAYGLVLSFNLTWVPHFTAGLGKPLTAVIWTAVVAGLIAGAWLSENAKQIRNSPIHSIPLALGIAGIGLALLGLTDGLWLPLFLVAFHEIGRGMIDPLMDNFIYSRVESSFKATYGSLQSMVSRGGFAAILGLQWLAMEGYFPQASDKAVWWASGTVMAVASGLLWASRERRG